PQADGGLPPSTRGDRRRLSAPDAPFPAVESGTALALLARDRLSRLCDGGSGVDYAEARGRLRVLARRRSSERASADPGQCRARRRLRKCALRTHALRAGAERT